MDHPSPTKSRRNACILIAVAALMVLTAACGASQADIDEAVSATRTADAREANAVASSVAATLAAAPQPTAPPAAEPVGGETPETTTGEFCPSPFSDLIHRSSGYLSGGRFMVTLENPGPFLDPEYILMINNLPYTCTPLAGQPEDRIYCIGQPRPPVGRASVELWAADMSCRIEIPFSRIDVPPVPQYQ